MKGVVYKLVRDRGFGFLRGEDGLSRFFHAKQVPGVGAFDRLQEQQQVLFTPTEDGTNDNKLRAIEVRTV